MLQRTVIAKDAALRAVGRTVVNFQRLEHNLKLAARLGPVHGTPPRIQQDMEKRIERSAALTLGQAVQAWLSAMEGTPQVGVYAPDLFDLTMQVTFSLDADAESRSAHAAALKTLLDTRNRLIHGGLVRFQWGSPDECERLVRELDAVNEQIGSQIEYFAAILKAISDIRPEDFEIADAELPEPTARLEKPADDA